MFVCRIGIWLPVGRGGFENVRFVSPVFLRKANAFALSLWPISVGRLMRTKQLWVVFTDNGVRALSACSTINRRQVRIGVRCINNERTADDAGCEMNIYIQHSTTTKKGKCSMVRSLAIYNQKPFFYGFNQMFMFTDSEWLASRIPLINDVQECILFREKRKKKFINKTKISVLFLSVIHKL